METREKGWKKIRLSQKRVEDTALSITVQIVCSFYPKLLFFHSSVQIIIYINGKDFQGIPLSDSARYVCMTHVPQGYSYWSWIHDVIDCSNFKYVARIYVTCHFF